MQSSSLLLSESPSSLRRKAFVRVECRGCRSQARLQPARLAATLDIASMTAVDLCPHGHGIPEVLLQRCPRPGDERPRALCRPLLREHADLVCSSVPGPCMSQQECSCCIEFPCTGGEVVSTFTIQEEEETWENVETDAPLVHVAYELPFNHKTEEGVRMNSRSSPVIRSRILQVSSPMAGNCTGI